MTCVLVAEDDPAIATLLSGVLGERLGAEVQVVANGALVPEALANRQPDLLILDVQLPGLSGLDIFDVVRNDPMWERLPILFLTALPEAAARAFAPTGVHRVMAKPFDIDELCATAEALLGGSTQAGVTGAAA